MWINSQINLKRPLSSLNGLVLAVWLNMRLILANAHLHSRLDIQQLQSSKFNIQYPDFKKGLPCTLVSFANVSATRFDFTSGGLDFTGGSIYIAQLNLTYVSYF